MRRKKRRIIIIIIIISKKINRNKIKETSWEGTKRGRGKRERRRNGLRYNRKRKRRKENGGWVGEGWGGRGGTDRGRSQIKVKSLRLIGLEVTDRVPALPRGATNLMQLLYNSLCPSALTANRTIYGIELFSATVTGTFKVFLKFLFLWNDTLHFLFGFEIFCSELVTEWSNFCT